MAPVADPAETTLCTSGDTPLNSSRRRVGRVGEAPSPLVARAVGRVRAGDRDALRFLYVRYADDVYGYARTIVTDHDEAREVTRRAFSRLECLIDRYEEHDAPFGVWIRRVARSVAAESAGQTANHRVP
jgi:RNA polymerase sigma-70 factor (ECF subfamily)